MTTANEIIREAMQALGVLNAGETASYEDAEDCRLVLNTLIDAWNLPGLTQYTTQDGTATLAGGSSSLTIGPAMNIAVTRPGRIEQGSYVRYGGIDYAMEGLSEPEYNAISLKTLGGFVPRYFFYDVGLLTGVIYYFPVPTASVVVHHPVATQFSAFADLTTSYNFPQGYKRAMVFNLAKEVAPHFQQAASPDIMMKASTSLRAIKIGNYSVPQLEIAEPVAGGLEAFYGGY
jgi:hypothetical protein